MPRKGHHLPLWLPDDLWSTLAEYCAVRRITKTHAVLEALRAFLGSPAEMTHREAVQVVRERMGAQRDRVATCPRGVEDCRTFDSLSCGGCTR